MIAFLINDLNIRGGTQKQFLKLLDYTSSMNIDFLVFAKQVDYNQTYPGLSKYKSKIITLKLYESNNWFVSKIYILRNCFKLRKELRSIDIINIHDGGFELYLPALIGKKVFWQINDMFACFKVGVHSGKLSLKDFLLKIYIITFSPIITEFTVNVSKNKYLIKHFFRRNAHLFYCGIEPIEVNKDNALSLDHFKNRKLSLLTSGVFFPYRNYETQVEIVKELLHRNIDVTLNIIGSTNLDKEYSNIISQLISNYDLNQRINICGQVDEDSFMSLHKNADLFLFVNVNQSWGLAVFEAMSCGIPVIVSNSVGATEILTDQKNSIFVNPYDTEAICDKIIEIMNDNEKYESISKISKQFVYDFSWDKSYSSKMINLFNYKH